MFLTKIEQQLNTPENIKKLKYLLSELMDLKIEEINKKSDEEILKLAKEFELDSKEFVEALSVFMVSKK